MPLGLIAAALGTDLTIKKKDFGLGMTKLIISHKKIDAIRKIIKSLEKSSSLIKSASKQIKIKRKDKEVDLLLRY